MPPSKRTRKCISSLVTTVAIQGAAVEENEEYEEKTVAIKKKRHISTKNQAKRNKALIEQENKIENEDKEDNFNEADDGVVDGTVSTEILSTTAKNANGKDSIKIVAKQKKTASHQILTERDIIPKLWSDAKAKINGSYTFKIASWNVVSLRALMNNVPNALSDLVRRHNLDVLCLQETKLQDEHLVDGKKGKKTFDFQRLLEDEGYDSYFSCSTAKKGYSGTAVFIRRRKQHKGTKKQSTLSSFIQKGKKEEEFSEKMSLDVSNLPPIEHLIPKNVSYKMGIEQHDTEGRLIVVDFPLFTMCNVYVPNSGEGLKRLAYRTTEWDVDFLAFVQQKQKDRGVPVMWLGDLNVAHTHLEVWNDGAKHLAKQAGVTTEERASFQRQLDSGFVDAFRRLHPEAKGHYSYWSKRSGNREPNKGLRLDYFICDPRFFEESSMVIVRDSYMDTQQGGSDHCPAIIELEIKSTDLKSMEED